MTARSSRSTALLGGLGDEILEFRVSRDPAAAIAALRRRGVAHDDAFVVGARVTVPLHGVGTSAALAVIDAEGLQTSELTARVPTLDDVYLNLTGARLDAAA
jgi:hypothetical protein